MASVNGPNSVVIAGDKVEVEAVMGVLRVEGKRLSVSHAFHFAAYGADDGSIPRCTDGSLRIRCTFGSTASAANEHGDGGSGHRRGAGKSRALGATVMVAGAVLKGAGGCAGAPIGQKCPTHARCLR